MGVESRNSFQSYTERLIQLCLWVSSDSFWLGCGRETVPSLVILTMQSLQLVCFGLAWLYCLYLGEAWGKDRVDEKTSEMTMSPPLPCFHPKDYHSQTHRETETEWHHRDFHGLFPFVLCLPCWCSFLILSVIDFSNKETSNQGVLVTTEFLWLIWKAATKSSGKLSSVETLYSMTSFHARICCPSLGDSIRREFSFSKDRPKKKSKIERGIKTRSDEIESRKEKESSFSLPSFHCSFSFLTECVLISCVTFLLRVLFPPNFVFLRTLLRSLLQRRVWCNLVEAWFERRENQARELHRKRGNCFQNLLAALMSKAKGSSEESNEKRWKEIWKSTLPTGKSLFFFKKEYWPRIFFNENAVE